jgi:hypothetical protein
LQRDKLQPEKLLQELAQVLYIILLTIKLLKIVGII